MERASFARIGPPHFRGQIPERSHQWLEHMKGVFFCGRQFIYAFRTHHEVRAGRATRNDSCLLESDSVGSSKTRGIDVRMIGNN